MTDTPEVGHRVIVEGREHEGVFVVLLVDHARSTVDLLRMDGVKRIEEGIPLQALQSADDTHAPQKTTKPD